MKEEDLKYADFWDKLDKYIAHTHMDVMFDSPRQTMDETEAAYEKARSLLDPETEDQLVLYCGACEQFCMTYAFAAYEMGREEGPRKPNETYRDWVEDPSFWESIIACLEELDQLRQEDAQNQVMK